MGSRIKGKELRSKVMAGSEGSGHGLKSELGGGRVGIRKSNRMGTWGQRWGLDRVGSGTGILTERG